MTSYIMYDLLKSSVI